MCELFFWPCVIGFVPPSIFLNRRQIHVSYYLLLKVKKDAEDTQQQLLQLTSSNEASTNGEEKPQENEKIMENLKNLKLELTKKKEQMVLKMETKKELAFGKMKKKTKEKFIAAKLAGKGVCLGCGKVDEKLVPCQFCTEAFYCSELCQEEHWFIHQKFCREALDVAMEES